MCVQRQARSWSAAAGGAAAQCGRARAAHMQLRIWPRLPESRVGHRNHGRVQPPAQQCLRCTCVCRRQARKPKQMGSPTGGKRGRSGGGRSRRRLAGEVVAAAVNPAVVGTLSAAVGERVASGAGRATQQWHTVMCTGTWHPRVQLFHPPDGYLRASGAGTPASLNDHIYLTPSTLGQHAARWFCAVHEGAHTHHARWSSCPTASARSPEAMSDATKLPCRPPPQGDRTTWVWTCGGGDGKSSAMGAGSAGQKAIARHTFVDIMRGQHMFR